MCLNDHFLPVAGRTTDSVIGKRQLNEEKVLNETRVKQDELTTVTFSKTDCHHTKSPTEVYTSIYRSATPSGLCLIKSHY
jgi:hypothetical protein